MAGRPKSVDDSKIFDISKPGKSKPMGTSRPVIVNHGAMVKDPTLVDSSEPTEKLSAPSVSRKIIAPVTQQPAPDEESSPEPPTIPGSPEIAPESSETTIVKVTKKPVIQVEAPVEVETKAEPVAEPEAQDEGEPEDTVEATGTDIEQAPQEAEAEVQEDSETEDIEAPAGSDSASVDALAEASEKKKTSAKEEEERLKREAALQELIDSKKYFVPIAHDSGKSGHKGLWFLLILLIVLIGAYAAIDAGVIETPIELPYHIF